jgi:hypothetical protein
MPYATFKIRIYYIAGYPIAYLKARVLFFIWITVQAQWLVTADDFEVVEQWMEQYKLTAKKVKQFQAA